MRYKHKFQSAEEAKAYDQCYSLKSVDNLLWEVEKPILLSLFEKHSTTAAHYLDFACGTGRVVSFLAPNTASATGIDISEQMLAIARTRAPGVTFLCQDILAEKDAGEKFDLVTSFRFLSNLDVAHREIMMRAIRARMTEGAVLLVNSHTNPFSYKFLLLPWHAIRKRLSGGVHTQYLATAEMKSVLERSGFGVIEVIGYGFVPGKLLSFIPWAWALRFERLLFAIPWLRRFGVNQIAVCKASAG